MPVKVSELKLSIGTKITASFCFFVTTVYVKTEFNCTTKNLDRNISQRLEKVGICK